MRKLLLLGVAVLTAVSPMAIGVVQAVSAPTRLYGTITGTINGIAVNMNSRITLNYATGHENADVFNVPVALGGSLRATTAIVTLGGGLGGKEQDGGKNVLTLTGGNFTNTAFQFNGLDTLRLVSSVTWNGVSDTAFYNMSVSGNVRVIAASSSVQVLNFVELWTAIGGGALRKDGPVINAAGSFTSSGSRGILINGDPPPPPNGGGKESVTSYPNALVPFPVTGLSRAASNFLTTFNSGSGVLHIECDNVITPTPPMIVTVPGSSPIGLGILSALALVAGFMVIRRREARLA